MTLPPCKPHLRVVVYAPILTISESNRSRHEHWGTTRRRAEKQRDSANRHLRSIRWFEDNGQPITITLTRLGVRNLDSGNLEAALKHVQDGVADWLKIDDGNPRLTWLYAQRQAEKADCGVIISVVQMEGGR
jgi:hypothetical protein